MDGEQQLPCLDRTQLIDAGWAAVLIELIVLAVLVAIVVIALRRP